MKIGIEKIAFHVPNNYVEMTDLAQARQVDPNKFHIGLGQDQMAVLPYTQDIVTLGANAAKRIVSDTDKKQIAMVIVGTESAHDFSKSAAVSIHHLLGIQPYARTYEIKHACYGGTAALQQAHDFVACHPDKKVLVIAADIAKYGLATPGEPTQGCGAVAMLVSAEPKILRFADDSVYYAEDVYDFWRPAGHDYPLVDGHLSNEIYVESFVKVWEANKKLNQRTASDYAALTFHLPYTKMGRKAFATIAPEMSTADQDRLMAQYEQAITYSRKVGNLYTGSLYLGLCSLLDHGTLKARDRIGLFSYGSGAVSEFFSLIVEPDFKRSLLTAENEALLAQRKKLTLTEYETLFKQKLPADGGTYEFDDTSSFAIKKISGDIRYYREA